MTTVHAARRITYESAAAILEWAASIVNATPTAANANAATQNKSDNAGRHGCKRVASLR